MMIRKWWSLLVVVGLLSFAGSRIAWSQAKPGEGGSPSVTSDNTQHAQSEAGEAEHGESAFTPHDGTWLHWLAQALFHQPPVQAIHKPGEAAYQTEYTNVEYDVYVVAILTSIGLVVLWILAARGQRLRPEGKPTSLANLFEAALEGFQGYLNGVMGEDLARKYAPLISSFFFTILAFNFIGLIPGLVKPTTNLNIPIGMALMAFLSVHFIAIKEVGVKNWFMHFVGEPLWLAPLVLPLHIVGELIKPVTLAIRLFCNMFAEEMVVAQLGLLALSVAALLHLPTFLPFQLPMLLLGVFFSFLQALVFATLLSIYISVMGTHHDEHGHEAEHHHGNGEAVSATLPLA